MDIRVAELNRKVCSCAIQGPGSTGKPPDGSHGATWFSLAIGSMPHLVTSLAHHSTSALHPPIHVPPIHRIRVQSGRPFPLPRSQDIEKSRNWWTQSLRRYDNEGTLRYEAWSLPTCGSSGVTGEGRCLVWCVRPTLDYARNDGHLFSFCHSVTESFRDPGRAHHCAYPGWRCVVFLRRSVTNTSGISSLVPHLSLGPTVDHLGIQ